MSINTTPVDRKWAETHLPAEVFNFCEKHSLSFERENHRQLNTIRSTLKFERNGKWGILLFLQLYELNHKVREIIEVFRNHMWEGKAIFDAHEPPYKEIEDIEFQKYLRAQNISLETPELDRHFQFFQHRIHKVVIKTLRLHFLHEKPSLLSQVSEQCLRQLPVRYRYKLLYLLDVTSCRID